jgi:hypothetical protein
MKTSLTRGLVVAAATLGGIATGTSFDKSIVLKSLRVNFRELRHCEVRRMHLLGTGVKIALVGAHFHGFGVARQGPWITWRKIQNLWS